MKEGITTTGKGNKQTCHQRVSTIRENIHDSIFFSAAINVSTSSQLSNSGESNFPFFLLSDSHIDAEFFLYVVLEL